MELHFPAQASSVDSESAESSDDQLEADFNVLVSEWHIATRYCSTIEQICSHQAYLKTIAKGKLVLPLIFKSLAQEIDHWFWALHEITGESPIREVSKGNLINMREDWMAWGRNHGYIS